MPPDSELFAASPNGILSAVASRASKAGMFVSTMACSMSTSSDGAMSSAPPARHASTNPSEISASSGTPGFWKLGSALHHSHIRTSDRHSPNQSTVAVLSATPLVRAKLTTRETTTAARTKASGSAAELWEVVWEEEDDEEEVVSAWFDGCAVEAGRGLKAEADWEGCCGVGGSGMESTATPMLKHACEMDETGWW
eukprot:TRINITY_DN8000_c0_g1_i1.p2 TRINITY_DN8000_c0_g1~~TRINITY_DN8000_c0_g1_i1.p2  ORF type:complete len:196 (-),score=2.50 TRINITY_DN8000_c0_g1_i1:254-841(-)